MNISPILDPFSIPVLLPKGGLWPLSAPVHEWWTVARQLCNVLHSQGKLHSLQGVLPSCHSYSAVQPSYPPHQVISWSQITNSEKLQFDFPLHSTAYTHKPTNLITFARFSEDQQNGNFVQKAALSVGNEGFFEIQGH